MNASGVHDMRRTYISTLLDSGADLMTVSELAGHTSMTTTAKYDRHGQAAKRAAMLKMTIPHVSQRAVARPERGYGIKIQTLASTKGGVGKSTLAGHLAAGVERHGA